MTDVAGTRSSEQSTRKRELNVRLERIAPGVFAYIQPDGTWHINNMGFVVGSDAVVAIDSSSTERRMRAFLEAIRRTASQPVRTLLNTHHHGDHTYGNCLVPNATIIGHDECRVLVKRIGISHFDGIFEPTEYGELRPNPPQVTFSDHLTIWVDELRLECRYIGHPAHSTNDVVVWIPEHRVLFAGDLVVSNNTPFLLTGSVTGALQAIDKVRAYPARVIVPGHGDLCDVSSLDAMARYYDFVLETASKGRAAGIPPLEAARIADLSPFAMLPNPERLVANLHRAYFEMDGHRPGEWLELGPAIRDMVAFNGGKPLTCLA